jgi:uncharacterized membrane protein
MTLQRLIRTGLLGIAAGGQSQTPFAALALTSTPISAGPAGLLDNRAVRVALTLAAVGELVADKLPQTPSRLAPQAYVPRLVVGAAAGAALASRAGARKREVVLAAVLGSAGAAAGSHAGAQWREFAQPRFGSPWPGALIEDVVVVSLAAVAVT